MWFCWRWDGQRWHLSGSAVTISDAHKLSLKLNGNLPNTYRGLTGGGIPDWIPQGKRHSRGKGKEERESEENGDSNTAEERD